MLYSFQGNTTAEDLAAIGVNMAFGPTAEIGVQPGWPRYASSFGEDPFMASVYVGNVARMLSGFNTTSGEADLTQPGNIAAVVNRWIGTAPSSCPECCTFIPRRVSSFFKLAVV